MAGRLAEEINADELIILTSVEKVRINLGTPEEEELGEITVSQAKQYMEEGHLVYTICCLNSRHRLNLLKREKGVRR